MWFWLILGAFLSGSVPYGLLIARARGVDIRKAGSGNIGATNVGRVLGKRYFFLCFALDVAKGLVPTLVAGWLAGALGSLSMPTRTAWLWLAVMIAAVLGHVFSPWLKFRGGKGVATSIGAAMGVFPALAIPGLGAAAIFLAVLAWKKYISLASMCAAASLPVFVFALFGSQAALGDGVAFITTSAAIGALVIWTHRSNIARLRAGTEPKVGGRTKALSDAARSG